MVSFTFNDYLTILERSVTRTTGDASEKRLQEVSDLRQHTATLTTMQKHLKNYKALKFSVESLGVELN
jgi:hypothetical protein